MAQPQNQNGQTSAQPARSTTPLALIALAWLWVALPLTWGIVQTVIKATALFH